MRSIRRSRSAAGLLAVAFLVAASGCGAEPADRGASPSDTETPDTIQAPSATWQPAVPDTPIEASTTVATPVAVSAPFDASTEDSQYVPAQWLVPWEDGFLAAGIRFAPQPLPDQLPPEIAELFPPEVNALFPDGLPPTQQEAMDILRDAGLLDVVMDVLNENPEAMDAVQSAPRPEPELVASWSRDGETWTPTEIAVPDGLGGITQLSSTGDRLTVAGSAVPVEDGDPWTVTVASTTDLENWNTASFTVAEPEGLPEDGQAWVSPVAVAADAEHWVVRIMVDATADSTSGTPYSEPRAELWSGTWDGEAAMSDADQPSWLLVATSEGFLDLGQSVRFSPDGQAWTDATPLGPNVNIQAATPLGDGVLAITGAPYGESSIVLLDATGTTADDVVIPELGNAFSTWTSMSSPAFIVDAPAMTMGEQTVVVEYDGFELTQEFGEVVTYRLVDLATGEVVAEESVDLRTTTIGETGPFESLTEDQEGITIRDAETGATILEIPQSVVSRAWQQAQAAAETVAPDGPDIWLLATTDGETWLVQDLDEGDPGGFNPPMVLAVNGTTVLTGTLGWEQGADVWQRYTMTE